jgi:hypothetical protein
MGILRRLIDCLPYVLRGEPVAPALFGATEAVYLARACYVAAELGIADLVENQPQTAAELAARTGCDELALFRVLRTLAAFDVFAQDAQGRFRLTCRGAPLASDRPDSQRHWTIFRGHRASCEAAARFLDAVKTGKNAFEIAHGKPFFDYCRDDPYLNEIFIKGMSGWTDWQAREVVRYYDFRGFGRVIDVGGGRGSLLFEVLKHHPTTWGVLYDLPGTVAEALPRIAAWGLEHRCEARGGNFLQEVPRGGQAYLLKHVLRDWDDNHARRILQNVRAVLPRDGRLLVIDATLDPRNGRDRLNKLMDLGQMTFVCGRMRTQKELEALLGETGFRVLSVRRTSICDTTILETAADGGGL